MKAYRLLMMIMMVIMLFLMGCQKNKEKEAEDGKVTLTLWNNIDAGKVYYPKIIEKFEKEYPDIKIDLRNLTPETGEAQMQAAISDNSLPDIFNQGTFTIAELVEFDLVQELDEIFPESERDEYVEGIFNEGNASHKGKVYLFPKYKGGTYYMFYNTNVLEEYGIESIPETWDELMEVGKEIYDKSNGSTYGLLFGGQSSWLLNAVSKLMATELSPESDYDYETGTYKFATDGFIETITYFKDLLDESVLSPTSLEVINEVALEYFANGESAFLIDGNWTGQLLDTYGFKDFGVVKLPTKHVDGQHFGSFSIGSNDGLYVSNHTEHWEEVKVFLKYLQDNLYEEILQLGTAVIAKDISNFDIELPFEQLEDISEIFADMSLLVPDPLVVNQAAQDTLLELKKNEPDTDPGTIFMGYLTNQVKDLEAELQKYEEEYNKAFTKAIEGSSDVEREDFQFPNWTPFTPYTDTDYDALED